MRCAVVEFNEFHGAILPTFVHLLDRLGFDVDVFLRARVLEDAPFALCPGLKYRLHDLDRPAVRARVRLGRFRAYDVVVATSVEPRAALNRVARAHPPVIGVMHNAVLLEEEPAYRAFFAAAHHRPLTLAEHIGSGAGTGWVAPVYLIEELESIPIHWRRFCVHGQIDLRRRNYWSLLEAVGELVAAGRTDFQVSLVGGDHDLDGIRLRRTIREQSLEAYFTANGGWRGYGGSVRDSAASGFVLPLVDTSSPVFSAYFADKLSSSLIMAIGLSRIPVVHHRLAELYGIRECAVTYRDGQLGSALATALDLPAARRQQMMVALDKVRARLLASSQAELASILRSLGLSHSR